MSEAAEKIPNDSKTQTEDLDRVQSNAAGHVIDYQAEEFLHRRLNNRQIQLIAIGGTIGTGLFINIGNALHQAGPVGLLLAFIVYSAMVAMVNNSMAEMITLYPVAGGFIRLAGQYVDEAFGFMAGWNFFIYEALVIPFEISALSIVVKYWNEDVPIWAMCLLCIVLYSILNVLVVNAYGEAEFWLSSRKVILILALFCFTIITMCGGNPKRDAYGFRNWSNPSSFATVRNSGNLGRFEGFLAAMWNVSFCVVGPEYISLIAAEAQHPRTYMKAAYKTVYVRFMVFFIGSALAVGTVLSWNDPTLTSILRGGTSGSGTAAASPYVIAMKNLNIEVFSHIVNFLLVTSIFSAGNTYVFCASRSLYSLAIEGRAPRFLTRVTKNGIPIYCFIVTICFTFLSFLQVDPSTADFLNTLVNLVTAGAFINYVVMVITYVCWFRAGKAQNLDRKSLPYYGWFQPYCGWISLVFFVCVVGVYGYASFNPWDIRAFFGCYTMAMLSIVLFIFWKLWKKTTFVLPHAADLVWMRVEVDAYERAQTDIPKTFWQEMTLGLFKRNKQHDSEPGMVSS